MLARRDDEGAEAEREETGRPRKGALGKEDEHPSSLSGVERLVHVLDTSFGISAIDEQRPQLPQERSGKELRLKLLLGNESGLPRDHCCENQSVEITRVVAYDNDAGCFRPGAGDV